MRITPIENCLKYDVRANDDHHCIKCKNDLFIADGNQSCVAECQPNEVLYEVYYF